MVKPIFSKKHYEKIALCIRLSEFSFDDLIYNLLELFEKDNDKFNIETFKKAAWII